MLEPALRCIARRCELVALSRSPFFHRPLGESAENLALMRRIGEPFLDAPWYGARQMARHRRRRGHTPSGASASAG